MSLLRRFTISPRDFFNALSSLKFSRASAPAIWSIISAMLFLAIAQPSAYGLDFPMATRLTLPDSPVNLVTQESPAALVGSALVGSALVGSALVGSALADLSPSISPDQKAALFTPELALVASASLQVEMSRTPTGAKRVAQSIMKSKYNWGSSQFICLNRLWTKESNWRYQARNSYSGAHGIAQALPASKMESISTDWRTNPVTQIQWGLKYISSRYSTPCKAWASSKRHGYY